MRPGLGKNETPKRRPSRFSLFLKVLYQRAVFRYTDRRIFA